MDKEKIIEALNQDRSLELAAIVQYMGHHYTAKGMESPAIIDLFKEISIVEMKHAEELGERIAALGGKPTNKPAEIKTGGDLKKMIQDDLDGEYMAIKQYKEHLKLVEAEDDSTTRLMLEEIIADEEDHANTWETILEK